MSLTLDNLLTLTRAAITRIGLSTTEHEMVGPSTAVLRLKLPNGEIGGSVTLTPHMQELGEDQATTLISASVLEAARAAIAEPIGKK